MFRLSLYPSIICSMVAFSSGGAFAAAFSISDVYCVGFNGEHAAITFAPEELSVGSEFDPIAIYGSGELSSRAVQYSSGLDTDQPVTVRFVSKSQFLKNSNPCGDNPLEIVVNRIHKSRNFPGCGLSGRPEDRCVYDNPASSDQ
jgi:hypothetical protein